jgi:hypothetical protein
VSEFRITTSMDETMLFSTNSNNIVIRADPTIKYLIKWNVSDVQDECIRKLWTLENIDHLRSRR